MAKGKKKAAKKPDTKSVAQSERRQRKLTRAQKKLVAKKAAAKRQKLPSSVKLVIQVFNILRKYWQPLGGIVLIYLLLNIIFASGFSNLTSSVDSIRTNLANSPAQSSKWLNVLGGFTALVGSGGSSSSATGSVLQSVLFILVSLVIIWALRQLLAGHKISVKQAYYHGPNPLVPFLLVLGVIFIQLLPVTLGTAAAQFILGSVTTGGAFISVLFVIIFVFLAAWSLYMVCGSIFALYIVTLPEMMPRDALRSAKSLVIYRRGPIIRKLIFLLLCVLVLMGVIVIPLIIFAAGLVAPVFFILSMLAILFAHTFLYSLYRSLLE